MDIGGFLSLGFYLQRDTHIMFFLKVVSPHHSSRTLLVIVIAPKHAVSCRVGHNQLIFTCCVFSQAPVQIHLNELSLALFSFTLPLVM